MGWPAFVRCVVKAVTSAAVVGFNRHFNTLAKAEVISLRTKSSKSFITSFRISMQIENSYEALIGKC